MYKPHEQYGRDEEYGCTQLGLLAVQQIYDGCHVDAYREVHEQRPREVVERQMRHLVDNAHGVQQTCQSLDKGRRSKAQSCLNV